ncbi:MAG: PspC domain-containing protein [Chloroflexi bacterium]|nr:PspC domain-containing protein [Chloroflexota bacterium]
MNDYRRLYRSRDDRMIAGVAGGLGEFLTLDPTVVRILFVLSVFFGGAGFLVYIAMMLIVPEEPFEAEAEAETEPKPKTKAKPKTKTAAKKKTTKTKKR